MSEQEAFKTFLAKEIGDYYDDFSDRRFESVVKYVQACAERKDAEIKALRDVKAQYAARINSVQHEFMIALLNEDENLDLAPVRSVWQYAKKHKLIDKNGKPTQLLPEESE